VQHRAGRFDIACSNKDGDAAAEVQSGILLPGVISRDYRVDTLTLERTTCQFCLDAIRENGHGNEIGHPDSVT
jgi:hypothetical protein